MKYRVRCIPCVINVRFKELINAVQDDDLASKIGLNIVKKAYELFSKFDELTHIATLLFRYTIEQAPSIIDYYRRVKEESIRRLLKMQHKCLRLLEGLEGYNRFKMAIKIAIAGNALDMGVAEYEPKDIDLREVLEKDLRIDHSMELYSMVSKGNKKIIYLLDNAGEAVFDAILINELETLGNKVIAVAKEEPGFQNDATLNDAIMAGIDKYATEVITTGTSASSIHLDEVSKHFLEKLKESDIIIAKGMAHFEYVSEIELGKPTYFLLIPKCDVIASMLNVEKHVYVLYKKTHQ